MLLLWHTATTTIHITDIIIVTFILRKQFITAISTVEGITVYGTDLRNTIITKVIGMIIT